MNKTRLASFADSLPVKVMLLFLVLQVVFILSNTAANCLPRPVIESHAQGSESSALLSDMYVYDHRVAAGPVCFDNNRFIIEVAQQKDQGSPFKTMTVAEIDDVTKACPSDYFPARALYEPKCDVIIFRVCLGPLFHTLYKPSPTRSLAYAQ